MARILVTGAKGVIGSWLTRLLRERGHQVFGVDLFHAAGEVGWEHEMSEEPFTYARCDIADFRELERVFTKAGPFDFVYHTAAEFGRWNGEDYYTPLWRSNAVGTKNIIRLQERLKFKLIHFSSSEVYGDWQDVMAEDVLDRHEIKQLNDYAMSKWVNEMQIRNSRLQHGTETVIVRLFNTYGPGEWYHPYRSVNCKFCYHALRDWPVTVYRGHTRTSTYIEDCCRTLANIVENFKPGEVYNIGGSEEHSIEELVDIVWRLTGQDPKLISYQESEILTTKTKKVDVSKAVRDLGHKTTVSLEEGVRRTLEWMNQYYGFNVPLKTPPPPQAEPALLKPSPPVNVLRGGAVPPNAQRRVALVVGARPNFVKAAAFFAEAGNHPDHRFTLIHTGQHYDPEMSSVFLTTLGLPQPDIHLGIRGERHTEKIGKMFRALREIFATTAFDDVVLFGDVNSTLAGAIAAARGSPRLIHIEAGLRSNDRRQPEEINRAVVDHLSDLLFTTEPSANENLTREGIDEAKVKYVGNLMIESLERHLPEVETSPIRESLGLERERYVLVTIHRQENTDDPYRLEAILALLQKINNVIRIVFPLHPGAKKYIAQFGLEPLLAGLLVSEPLGYFDFMKLMVDAYGVITDSGGIQEETTHLGIPCATIRDSTERPITLERGSNKLFSPHRSDAYDVLAHLTRRDFLKGHIPLWDTEVSARIFAHL